MNKLKKVIALAGVAVMCLSAHDLMAQAGGGGGGGGRRNFDPAQARQQMLDGLKDSMAVTNDDEWNVLQAAITKVMDANQDVQSSTPRAFGRGGRNRNGGGGGNGGGNGGATNNAGGGTGGGGRRGGFTPSPEVEALSASIEANASADEIKGKLTAVRSALESKQAKLVAAQADLQKLVSTRQEAILVLRGILK